MRWLHIAVVIIFAVAVLLLLVQNLEVVTVSFLGFSARAPLALLVAIVYVLGMATGSSLWSLLRDRRARTSDKKQSYQRE